MEYCTTATSGLWTFKHLCHVDLLSLSLSLFPKDIHPLQSPLFICKTEGISQKWEAGNDPAKWTNHAGSPAIQTSACYRYFWTEVFRDDKIAEPWCDTREGREYITLSCNHSWEKRRLPLLGAWLHCGQHGTYRLFLFHLDIWCTVLTKQGSILTVWYLPFVPLPPGHLMHCFDQTRQDSDRSNSLWLQQLLLGWRQPVFVVAALLMFVLFHIHIAHTNVTWVFSFNQICPWSNFYRPPPPPQELLKFVISSLAVSFTSSYCHQAKHINVTMAALNPLPVTDRYGKFLDASYMYEK